MPSRITGDDGATYVGQVTDGKREGLGVLEFKDGDRQVGEWKDNVLNGLGIERLNDGPRYEGQWRNGLPAGLGVREKPGTERAEGNFAVGRLEGLGTRRVLTEPTMTQTGAIRGRHAGWSGRRDPGQRRALRGHVPRRQAARLRPADRARRTGPRQPLGRRKAGRIDALSVEWHGSCAPRRVNKPLSVLLIDDNPARAEIVESGLREAGYRLLARLQGTQDLPARVRELAPDVVVVSTDSPSRDAIEDMRRSTEQQPRPIALFVDQSDPATIAAAMEAGVSAYVVNGLAQDRVRSVVDVAVGHFNRYHAMREELERARLTLLERKSVDRAKGLLMEQRGMGEEAAYKLLRKLAMDQNKRIGEVAQEIVTYAKVLKK